MRPFSPLKLNRDEHVQLICDL
uniref:Uncharacterized protein n=1 Tax=Anguilla anguilla TaxID=7936 RepID=A0A0E9XBS1_ANGAN